MTHYKRFILITFLFCLSFARGGETVAPFSLSVTNYTPSDYKGLTQNFCVAEGPDGSVYFGNRGGMLSFDGSKWSNFDIEDKLVRSIAINNAGEIYLGSNNDFGILKIKEDNSYQFHSLRSYTKINDFGNVWGTYIVKEGVYFQSSQAIFFWNGEELKVWESELEFKFHVAFIMNGEFYVRRQNIGLCTIRNGELELVKGGGEFKGISIYEATEDLEDEGYVLLTRRNGLFKVRFDGQLDIDSIYSITTDQDTYFKSGQADMRRIKGLDNLYSLGSWGDGIIIMDRNFQTQYIVNKNCGLSDGIVYGQYLDKSGQLWLALSNGISKVDLSSPLFHFDKDLGLESSVEAIQIIDDQIYAATFLGVYNLNTSATGGSTLNNFEPAKFKKIKGIDEETFSMEVFSGGITPTILAGANTGVYELIGSQFQFIHKCNVWDITASEANPNIVYVGHDVGLSILEKKNNQWRVINEIKLDQDIFRVYEFDDKVYCATYWNGVKVFDLPLQKEIVFEDRDTTHGIPSGPFVMERYYDQILYATGDKLFTYDEEMKRFFPTEHVEKGVGVHRFKADEENNLWMVSYNDDGIEVGYMRSDFSKVTKPFTELNQGIIHSIQHQDGVTWLAGALGVYRYDRSDKKNYTPDFKVNMKGIYIGQDSLIDGGVLPVDASITRPFTYENNSFTFHYAAAYFDHEEETQYSVFLDGFDEKWTNWSSEAKSIYTNLSEGDYSFQVKAKNFYGHESSITRYNFTIAPPWYRTWWAYILYVISLVAVVYYIIILYTRGLRQIIKQATAEIKEQKDEIEQKNTFLEQLNDAITEQKEEIEYQNQEIISSITYAKRIQEAILPPEKVVKQHLKDSFILYKPKDIVSGDFYWVENQEDKALFAAVDCTGHGVPGAFVSIVGNNGLQAAVKEFGLIRPNEILDKLTKLVEETFSKNSDKEEIKDGMDMALCSIDYSKKEVLFAGANNPLFVIRKKGSGLVVNGEEKEVLMEGETHDLFEVKGDPQPIGAYLHREPFTSYSFEYQPGDLLYVFSDGYVDQFGGPRNKKFLSKRFRTRLLEISEKKMAEQYQVLDDTIENWKGDNEQLDDICVFGVKLAE